MRIPTGPGYRVYFTQQGDSIYLLLLGGDNDEVIACYLSEVLADGDMDELLEALKNVARAKGMSEVASAAGLGRESLYKALTPGAKPRFDTINRVLKALGVRLKADVA